jgi:DNA-binding GntR family transcriptional regulator
LTAITGRAKYQQVADDLRQKIVDGTYEVEDELPSITRLTELYGVSSTVVKAAVKELKTEGVVIGQPGKAVYVVRRPDPTQPVPDLVDVLRQFAEFQASLQDALTSITTRLDALEKSIAKSRPRKRA